MRIVDFPHVLERARQGDAEAVQRIVVMLEPTLQKQSALAGDDDAYSDLVVWLLKAIRKYPGVPETWVRHVDGYRS